MYKTIFYGLCLMVGLTNCATYRQDLPIQVCSQLQTAPAGYSKATELQQALQDLTRSGVPGCALAVYSPEGWWEGAAGLAGIEKRLPMQSCHLQYLQSISKTYLAVAVLQLYESGKIGLDSAMYRYLPEKYGRYLPATDKITIRMLLNHTSGLPEYNFSPAYVSYLLQHPDHEFTTEDYLGYIEGKAPDFPPGSRYAYRNTNYVVLALIVDALTGDHSRYIADHIFEPLALSHTFYRNDPGYLNYPELVNTYWDRYSNGIVENVSRMQRNNVAALIGDDGIVTTPVEAVKFLRGLLEGELLSSEGLAEMQQWVFDGKGNPRYALGLEQLSMQGQKGIGHSGGGIGAGCELYYFPDKRTYVFIAVNLGTVTGSPLHEGVGEVRERIYEILLR